MVKNADKKEIQDAIDAIRDRHEVAKSVEEFEEYLHANLSWIVDDVVGRVLGPKAIGDKQTEQRLVQRPSRYAARFDAAFQTLTEELFPTRPAFWRSGTRSGGTSSTLSGVSKVPSAEWQAARVGLPDWFVVPHLYSRGLGQEFAICWLGDGDTPDLPGVDLLLDGAPVTSKHVGQVLPAQFEVGNLPPRSRLVAFEVARPTGFELSQTGNGRLVINFTTV